MVASLAFNKNIPGDILGHVAAFCLFEGKSVVRTLSVEEFESVIERESALDGFHGEIRVAFVVANQSQLVQSIVLFILPLGEDSFLQEGWRIPLERLSNTANRGPNLGGGRIRLSCHSQCSISSYQNSLWDPGARHFSEIKKSMELYLAEFDGALEPIDLAGVSDTASSDQISDVDRLRRELRNESATYRNEMQVLQQEVERQGLLNERLMEQIKGESDVFDLGATRADRLDLQALRRQNELLDMKLRELQVINDKLRLGSGVNCEDESDVEHLLEKMVDQEMMVVVYRHGIGHINLTPDHILEYVEDPMAYAANHIHINKLQYSRWLEHEEKPKCHVCGDEVRVVVDPSVFDFDVDVYCSKHKP